MKDESIEIQIKKHAMVPALKQVVMEKLSMHICEYEAERGELWKATSQVCLFLKRNSTTAINDKATGRLDHHDPEAGGQGAARKV